MSSKWGEGSNILNSLHILGGWHGAGTAGLCARDSVLLSRLDQKWFVLLDNLSMQWLSIVWLHVPESQFSYQQSRWPSLRICLNWLYQLQFLTFWSIISRPLQSLTLGVSGLLKLFPVWPNQRSEACAFLKNPKYLNSAPAGARLTTSLWTEVQGCV